MKSEKTERNSEKQFVSNLTCCQQILYAHIYAQVNHEADAWDVLQETNLYIWKNPRPELTNDAFVRWAKAMATLQVRKFRLYAARRSQHVVYDEPTYEAIVEGLATVPDAERPLALDAFDRCFAKLSPEDRECLNNKYVDQLKSAELAKRFHTTIDGIACRLYRLRHALNDCVVKQICRLRGEER